MSNIIERLRSATPYSPPQIELAHTAHDAADVMAAMLEALEKCEKYLSDLHDAVGFAFSGGRTEKQLAAVRAAIKAAKGE